MNFRCSACGHVFEIHREDVSLARPFLVLQEDEGEVLPFDDLADVQRAIVERRIGSRDQLSERGGTWKPLGQDPRFTPFFSVVGGATGGNFEASTTQSSSTGQSTQGMSPVSSIFDEEEEFTNTRTTEQHAAQAAPHWSTSANDSIEDSAAPAATASRQDEWGHSSTDTDSHVNVPSRFDFSAQSTGEFDDIDDFNPNKGRGVQLAVAGLILLLVGAGVVVYLMLNDQDRSDDMLAEGQPREEASEPGSTSDEPVANVAAQQAVEPAAEEASAGAAEDEAPVENDGATERVAAQGSRDEEGSNGDTAAEEAEAQREAERAAAERAREEAAAEQQRQAEAQAAAEREQAEAEAQAAAEREQAEAEAQAAAEREQAEAEAQAAAEREQAEAEAQAAAEREQAEAEAQAAAERERAEEQAAAEREQAEEQSPATMAARSQPAAVPTGAPSPGGDRAQPTSDPAPPSSTDGLFEQDEAAAETDEASGESTVGADAGGDEVAVAGDASEEADEDVEEAPPEPGTVAYYELELASNPGNLDTYMDLARAQASSGDLQGAHATYSLALQRNGNYLPALFGIAAVERRIGRRDSAIQRYQRIVAISPSSSRAEEARRELYELGVREEVLEEEADDEAQDDEGATEQ